MGAVATLCAAPYQIERDQAARAFLGPIAVAVKLMHDI
jgi:hypothetical protein